MANHFKLDFGSVTIAAAGEERLGGGDLLRIYEISGTVDLYFYKAGGVLVGKAIGVNRPIAFDFFRDFKIDGNERSFMDIKLTSTAGATVDYSLSEGIKTESNVFEIIAQKASSKTSSASVIKADTETLVIAANSSRRDLIIKNKSGNGGTVWTGGAVDTGIPIESGEVYIFENFSGAITLYSELATEICVEQVLG